MPSACILKSYFGYAASKEDLIPPVPILTRYKKEAGIKAFVKKELFDPRLPDEKRSTEINVLTTATLCIQLNTLYVSSSLSFLTKCPGSFLNSSFVGREEGFNYYDTL